MDNSQAAAAGLAAQPGRLIIVCGLPGSGKSTQAARLAAQRRGVRFAPDEWLAALGLSLWDDAHRERIESLQWRLAQDLLAAGGTAIIEWGSWARSERDELRLQARSRGWAVELCFLDVPFEELWRRIRARNREDPRIHLSDLQQWWARFEPPGPEELSFYDAPP